MGHLFVAQGDLTKLACDALVIPCDEKLNVSDFWRPILPPILPRGDSPNWLRIAGTPNDAGVVELPTSNGRTVRAFVSPWSGYSEPQEPIDRLWTALNDVAISLVGTGHRTRPLIGIPLVGTGGGGLGHRRGEVISKLLDRHRRHPLEIDLALVLKDPRDFAAVQNERWAEHDWPELDGMGKLRSKADELGRLASNKQISLFMGSGVSRPVGLPDWPRLIELLSEEAGIDTSGKTFEEAATEIKEALGTRYWNCMENLIDSELHSVGHALLAGLRVHQMVTTNFDPCMELALAGIAGMEYRVMVRQLADGGKPWLLKLHGDIKLPGSLILDTHDFERHIEENKALCGVVQSLLLTSHLLFVGFSFRDRDFLELADSVSKVRASADPGSESEFGTALALTENEANDMRVHELSTFAMLDANPDEAARLLEIFLDRLAWVAANDHDLSSEYLLDDRYTSGLSEPDRSLREILLRMRSSADQHAKSSSGWARLATCLKDLGAEPEK